MAGFLRVLSCLALLAIAAPLFAADGQIDLLLDPSATTTIATPGSYVLVSDVTFTPTASGCLTITADDVAIDLNGHTITGPGGANGNSYGIIANGNNITIRNGTIRTFGNAGIRNTVGVRTGLVVEDMTIRDMNSAGVIAQQTPGVTVRRCHFSTIPKFSGTVIGAAADALIEDCKFEGITTLSGATTVISASAGSVIRNNTMSGYTSTGGSVRAINVSGSAIIEDNLIVSLVGDTSTVEGISISGSNNASTVRNNTIRNYFGVTLTVISVVNGTVTGNVIDTAACTSGALVGIAGDALVCEGNTLRSLNASNGGCTGIMVNERSRVAGNVVHRLTATGATCRGIALTTTSGSGVAGGIVEDNSIGSLNIGSGAFEALGIEAGGRARIAGNAIHSITSSAGAATGIGLNAFNSSAINNEVVDVQAGGSGLGIGIKVNSGNCHVDSNFVSDVSGPNGGGDSAIQVTPNGDQSIVVGNHLTTPFEQSLQFVVGADNCYYAGNILENIAVSNLGGGNTAGTTPAANVLY